MGYYTAMKNDNYEDKEETTICNTNSVAKKERAYIVIYTWHQLCKITIGKS